MTTGGVALPLLGLRIKAGPVELRGITDDLLGPLAEIATDIHDPDFMPFAHPWSLTRPAEMPLSFAQYHWGVRAAFSPAKWTADFAVFFDGELAGTQGLVTEDYLVRRGGETGSWLGRRFQGRGIGTAMRQVICAFAFDCLDARYVTSTAFRDNPASRAVSRKVGYTANGYDHVTRLGKPAVLERIILEPAQLIRYPHEMTVEGLPQFRRSIGLDVPEESSDSPAGADGLDLGRLRD